MHDQPSEPGFLRNLGRRFGRVFHDESSWMEFSSGATTVAWALLCILDPRPLDYWRSMTLITDRMPAELWLALSLALGLMQLGALLWRRTILRGVAVFVAAWWWSFMAYCIYQAVGAAPGVVAYLGWAVPNCLAVWKHSMALFPPPGCQGRR